MSDTSKSLYERLGLRMADRRVFRLNAKRWDAFMMALAKPPKDNQRLRKLLARKPKWEA
jgi:uncharacterized protein (DUF1778 family)